MIWEGELGYGGVNKRVLLLVELVTYQFWTISKGRLLVLKDGVTSLTSFERISDKSNESKYPSVYVLMTTSSSNKLNILSRNFYHDPCRQSSFSMFEKS